MFSFFSCSRSRREVELITSGLKCSFWVSRLNCDPSVAESVCRFSSESVAYGESSGCNPADLMVLELTSDVNLGRIS